MKRVHEGSSVVLAFIVAIATMLAGCAVPALTDGGASESARTITYVTPEVVRRMQHAGPVLLIEAGSPVGQRAHIADAVNLQEVDLGKLRLPIGANVVFYNAGFGNKAARAAAAKLSGSDVNVAVMDGGLLAWIRAGLPVSQEASADSVPVGVTSAELHRAIRDEDKFLLIDLRGSVDFSISRIEGARNLAVDKLAAESAKWPKDRWIIFYDSVGKHSEFVADEMRRKGFPYTGYLSGGYDVWLKESTTKSN